MYKKGTKPAFSIHYDEDGKIIEVTSTKLEVIDKEGQKAPRGITITAVVNTTMIVGEHNPRCVYIWVPGWGWVWVCW